MTKFAYKLTKLGQQNFIPSSRVGLLFTFNTNNLTDIDQQNLDFNGLDATSGGAVGRGYGAENRIQPTFGKTSTGDPRELLVGAGWRSVRIQQDINVTQEGALGFFDILETIEHNVQSNSMTTEKLALRAYALNQVGVAPWGKDVLTSPRLNCYIYDPKEWQRGVSFGYLKLFGLHIQTNGWNANNGSPVMENVTFRMDRIQRVKKLPTGIITDLRQQFPTIYTGIEQLEEMDIEDEYLRGASYGGNGQRGQQGPGL